ncbi:hypothetical protein H0H92_008059, partial [Tricholoma furcatifolium]
MSLDQIFSSIIPANLSKGFWDLGHELFRTTPETYPAAFIAGDALDPNLIAPRAPFTEVPSTARPTNFSTLTSLTPLHGHISAIHVSQLFHLFDEHDQYVLAQRIATLLSPLPGSIMFGSQMGMTEIGLESTNEGIPGLFCHSPESWCDLWDGQIFEKGTVEVKAFLRPIKRPDKPKPFNFM